MKKISLLLCTLLICSVAFSQETETKEEKETKKKRIMPFRIGVKAGIPNGVGGGIEYVTPLLNQRIALFGDYSGFSAEIDDIGVKWQYYEIGTNIYIFGGKGRGVYGSLSYGNLSIDGTFTDSQTIGGEDFTGEAEGSFDVGTFNVKAGLKFGKRFYFRTELGYGFGDVPQVIVINGNVNGTPAVGIEEIPEIPGMSESGYVIFNLGFGVGF